MLKVSIVIPSLHDARRLESTLISLLENRPSYCEIVVPHSGHYDDPYEIADEVRLIEVPAARTEMELLAVGVSMCQGEIVHTLSPGATVEAGWLESVLPRFDRPEVGAVVPELVYASGKSACGVTVDGLGLRSAAARQTARGPLWQAGFYRHAVLEALGGFCTRLDEYADLDVALWIEQAGGVCEVVPGCRVHLDTASDLHRVTPQRIRLAKTLQLRHQSWFAAHGKSAGKLGWLTRTVGSGSLSAVMSALTAGPDAKAALYRLPDLDDVRAALSGHTATIRFDARHDQASHTPHRRAA